MEKYHKLMSLFSYLFGFIALIAVLVDDKKDKLYSFYIWQAFLLKVIIDALLIVYLKFYILNTILTMEISLRTSFFHKLFSIPSSIILLIFILLGILAYKEIKFNIPLIGTLAKKITKFEVI